MLWLGLLPVVLRRLVFEPALDPPLRPTLFILAAPAGLACNSILNLAPEAPVAVPATLAYFGVFMIAALLFQPRFILGAGVTLSWWGTTFPVATVATAILGLSQRTGSAVDLGVGVAVLALACAFTTVAVVATVRAFAAACLGDLAMANREIAAMRGEARAP